MPSQPADAYIEVDGIKTRYWRLGDAGSPVVFLHGLGGYLDCWRRNVGEIAKEHRVYAPDLPGHGLSGKPRAPYTVDFFTEFVRAFLAAQGIEKAGLVGLSFGGAISLRFTILHPRMVTKLVLVSSAGLGPRISPALRMASLPLFGELAVRPGRRKTEMTARFAICRPEMRTGEWLELTHRMTSQPGAPEALLKILRNHVTIFGPKKKLFATHQAGLSSLAVPALILHGREDKVIPAANALTAQEKIPGCRVVIFDRCGHELQYECAEAFNHAVREFLQD